MKNKCPWNPLNLFGETKLKKIKEEKTIDREKIQKRLILLEKRLSLINGKIDKCENLKQDYETEISVPQLPKVKTITAHKPNPQEHHVFRVTSPSGNSLNYMELAKERIRKKSGRRNVQSKNKTKNSERFEVSQKYNKLDKLVKKIRTENKINLCEQKSSFHIDTPADDKEDDLVLDPCTPSGEHTQYPATHLDNEKPTTNSIMSESIDTETQTMSAPEQSRQDIETLVDSEQCSTQNTKEPKPTSRQFSRELASEKKIKSIINEAVDECLGKSLQKFFEGGLEGYLKKRIESVVKKYSFVNPVIQRIASAYSSEFAAKDSSKVTEKRSSVTSQAASGVKTMSANPSKPSNQRSVRSKYGKEIRAQPSKSNFKPHSAPSFSKDVVSKTAQWRNKALISPRHVLKPTPSFQRKQRWNPGIN